MINNDTDADTVTNILVIANKQKSMSYLQKYKEFILLSSSTIALAINGLRNYKESFYRHFIGAEF